MILVPNFLYLSDRITIRDKQDQEPLIPEVVKQIIQFHLQKNRGMLIEVETRAMILDDECCSQILELLKKRADMYYHFSIDRQYVFIVQTLQALHEKFNISRKNIFCMKEYIKLT